jgi:excisionase family DNA binding protein
MSERVQQITARLQAIGAAWAVRSDKFCDPNDSLEAQAAGLKTYHVHPDAGFPHWNDVVRFRTLDEIEDWIEKAEAFRGIVTVAQAAEILQVSTRRVRQFIMDGRLNAQRFGPDWAIERESVARMQTLQQAQKAWRLLGITPRLWGSWWLSDVDEIETFTCPNCAGLAYSPAGSSKYAYMAACPSCGWAEKDC